MAPRALLTRLLTRLLSSRIARRCARARFHMQHATYACTGPRSGVAPTCMQDPCQCPPQRSTCPGGRVALGSALRAPRAPGSRPAPPHPRPPRALAPWASWRGSRPCASEEGRAPVNREQNGCERGCCTVGGASVHARAAAHQWHACKGGGSSVAVHVPRRACMQGRRLISG